MKRLTCLFAALALLAPLALCSAAEARPHIPAKVAKAAGQTVAAPVKLTARQIRRMRANGTYRREAHFGNHYQGPGNSVINYCPSCK